MNESLNPKKYQEVNDLLHRLERNLAFMFMLT